MKSLQKHVRMLAPVELLPAAVRDRLAHSIAVRTPLWRSAELRMRAEIRLGRWRRLTARQILAPPAAFVWAATAWMGVLPVSGYDRYTSGEGRMRRRLLGRAEEGEFFSARIVDARFR